MGLLEAAAAAVTGAENRIEIASRNISNIQTPGYKREIAFTEIVGRTEGANLYNESQPSVNSAFSKEAGVLTETGNALDIAVRGQAYLLLRDGDRFFLSHGGQFRRDRDGAMVDAEGRIVQQAGGGDLLLDIDTPEITADGTVLSQGIPTGTIGLFAIGEDIDATSFRTGLSEDQAAALTDAADAIVEQGMLERSNVTLSDEMIGLTRTQRMAESGAQLVRAYDQLIGQAVSTFGRRNG